MRLDSNRPPLPTEFGAPSLEESIEPNICLIGGSGRSGTTILRTILSKHPDVAETREWRFSIDPDGLIDFYSAISTGWSPFLFDAKLQRLSQLLHDTGQTRRITKHYRALIRKFNLHNLFPRKLTCRYSNISIVDYCPAYCELVEELIKNLTAFQYHGYWVGQELFATPRINFNPPLQKTALADILGRFFRQVVDCVLKAQNAQHYLDNNTWNILWFDKLLELIPEAKLVHIYRDPRDVVASYTRQAWTPSSPSQSAEFYLAIMNQWWSIREQLHPESYKEISLESLVSNPEATLRDLCEFWHIDWNPILLQTDLSRPNTGRWKTDFDAREQLEICDLLRDVLLKLGYQE